MQTYLSELYNFIYPSPTKEYHEQTIASFIFNAPSIVLSPVFVKIVAGIAFSVTTITAQQFTTGQFEACQR